MEQKKNATLINIITAHRKISSINLSIDIQSLLKHSKIYSRQRNFLAQLRWFHKII